MDPRVVRALQSLGDAVVYDFPLDFGAPIASASTVRVPPTTAANHGARPIRPAVRAHYKGSRTRCADDDDDDDAADDATDASAGADVAAVQRRFLAMGIIALTALTVLLALLWLFLGRAEPSRGEAADPSAAV
jgi:hypothetical protein